MDILAQLKAERDRVARQLNGLDTAIAALSGLDMGGGGIARRPRRRLSAKARARIAAAQRARWARDKRQKVVPIAQARKAGKRTMSASARRKIAAAQRARWAKVRRAKA